MNFIYFIFFFNAPTTTDTSTLSLHDALPICLGVKGLQGVEALTGEIQPGPVDVVVTRHPPDRGLAAAAAARSEEHTSELQSRFDLVCRLLLENENKKMGIQEAWPGQCEQRPG